MTIDLEGNHKVDLSYAGIPDFTEIILLPIRLLGGMPFQDMRRVENVVIPDDIEQIGNNWFWGSGVESVKIAKNVREIGACAFRNCRKLRQITFLENS